MEKNTLFKHKKESHSTALHRNHNPIDFLGDGYIGTYKKHPYFHFEVDDSSPECYLENLTNPLATISQTCIYTLVEETCSKLSLKKFYSLNRRMVGRPYFQKEKNCYYFTINLDSGDFYVGNILNYQKKRKFTKKINKNPIFTFSYLCNSLHDVVYNITNEKEIISELFEIVGNKLNSSIKIKNTIDMAKAIILFHFDKKGIKLPNNIDSFFNEANDFLPRMKDYKKHGKKFIDTFMELHKLKGNEIKKALHITKDVNVYALKSMIDVWGYDTLYRENLILPSLNASGEKTYYGPLLDGYSKKEKNIILQYFKWMMVDGSLNSSTISDHLKYYQKLKSLGEDIQLKSKNIDEFIREHADWATLVATYQDGYHVRKYPEKLINTIEETIVDDNGVEFSPVVLTSSDSYIDESTVQHNCVRTYIEKPQSLIVSLRESKESKQRATLEYLITYNEKNKKFFAERIQSTTKFNAKIPETLLTALEILDKRVALVINECEFDMSIKTTYKNGKNHTRRMKLVEIDNKNLRGSIVWDMEIHNEKNTQNNFDFLNF